MMLRFLTLISLAFMLGTVSHQDELLVLLSVKGDGAEYVSKMVLNNHKSLLLAPKSVSNSEYLYSFVPKQKHALYWAELNKVDSRRLEHEIFRFQKIALLEVPLGVFPHFHDDQQLPIGLVKVGFDRLHVLKSAIKPEMGQRSSSFNDDSINIDPEILETRLKQLTGRSPVRLEGREVRITERGSAEGKRLAREFLKEKMEALGAEVTMHTYGGGTNLVAELKSEQSDEFVIVSAHLDSVYNAGADDDASGIVSAWAVMEEMSKIDRVRGIRFVAFDQEEVGLVGSQAYADDLAAQQGFVGMRGVFNLEMTAYDSDNDGAIHVIDCNEGLSSSLSARMMQSISENEIALQKIPACTNRSDHAAFWQHGQPAIVISQNFFGRPADSNPCYHRSCDTVDNLNFSYMAKVTLAVSHAIRSLIQ
jgi:hypothetical protein